MSGFGDAWWDAPPPEPQAPTAASYRSQSRAESTTSVHVPIGHGAGYVVHPWDGSAPASAAIEPSASSGTINHQPTQPPQRHEDHAHRDHHQPHDQFRQPQPQHERELRHHHQAHDAGGNLSSQSQQRGQRLGFPPGLDASVSPVPRPPFTSALAAPGATTSPGQYGAVPGGNQELQPARVGSELPHAFRPSMPYDERGTSSPTATTSSWAAPPDVMIPTRPRDASHGECRTSLPPSRGHDDSNHLTAVPQVRHGHTMPNFDSQTAPPSHLQHHLHTGTQHHPQQDEDHHHGNHQHRGPGRTPSVAHSVATSAASAVRNKAWAPLWSAADRDAAAHQSEFQHHEIQHDRNDDVGFAETHGDGFANTAAVNPVAAAAAAAASYDNGDARSSAAAAAPSYGTSLTASRLPSRSASQHHQHQHHHHDEQQQPRHGHAVSQNADYSRYQRSLQGGQDRRGSARNAVGGTDDVSKSLFHRSRDGASPIEIHRDQHQAVAPPHDVNPTTISSTQHRTTATSARRGSAVSGVSAAAPSENVEEIVTRSSSAAASGQRASVPSGHPDSSLPPGTGSAPSSHDGTSLQGRGGRSGARVGGGTSHLPSGPISVAASGAAVGHPTPVNEAEEALWERRLKYAEFVPASDLVHQGRVAAEKQMIDRHLEMQTEKLTHQSFNVSMSNPAATSRRESRGHGALSPGQNNVPLMSRVPTVGHSQQQEVTGTDDQTLTPFGQRSATKPIQAPLIDTNGNLVKVPTNRVPTSSALVNNGPPTHDGENSGEENGAIADTFGEASWRNPQVRGAFTAGLEKQRERRKADMRQRIQDALSVLR